MKLFLLPLIVMSSMSSLAALPSQTLTGSKKIKSETTSKLVHDRELLIDILQKEKRPLSSVRQKELKSLYADLLIFANNSTEVLKNRWSALMMAVEINPEKAKQDLIPFAKSTDWFMRNAALLGIESIDSKKSYEMARELIHDRALVVRSAAVEVLSKSNRSEDRQLLWNELMHERNIKGTTSLWIRGQIIEVLNKKPQVDEIKKFAALLFDRDQKTQKSVIPVMEKLTSLKFGQTEKSVRSWQQFAKNEHLVSIQ